MKILDDLLIAVCYALLYKSTHGVYYVQFSIVEIEALSAAYTYHCGRATVDAPTACIRSLSVRLTGVCIPKREEKSSLFAAP